MWGDCRETAYDNHYLMAVAEEIGYGCLMTALLLECQLVMTVTRVPASLPKELVRTAPVSQCRSVSALSSCALYSASHAYSSRI